ncbi:MAG TPA: CopD family protein [Candidatus Binataceae bacterium]|nr:CopD family protein [Candidatus Binataceae bacterium]
MEMAGSAELGRFLCDWPLLASWLLIFGISGFAVRAPVPVSSALGRRLAAQIRLLTLLQLGLWPLLLIEVASSMAGVGTRATLPLLPAIVSQTRFGHLWLYATPLVLAMVALSWRRSLTLGQARLLVLLSTVQLLLWAASGHAIDYGPAAIGAYLIHELAAGLWLGSLLGLWLAAPLLPGDALGKVALQLSRTAGWCVAALVVSGSYLAYRSLGLDLTHLLYSSYGRTLLWKLALFGGVVAIGGYNRYRLLPTLETESNKLLRNVAAESLLLIVIIGVAALLANTPPAHMAQ